jgi:hypothetical protein
MAKSFEAAAGSQAEPVDSGYRDPAQRFSIDIPVEWKLTQRGENGQDGIILKHEEAWILVTPRKGERVEEPMAAYSRQAQMDYTGLQEGKHGRLDVNGHRGMTDCFTGVDSNGSARSAGMTSIDMGKGNSVTIEWSAPQEKSVEIAAAVEKVQQSIW